MPSIDELIEQYSFNREVSEANKQSVLKVSTALNHALETELPDLGYGIVAGGAIRDTILGLPVNDYDIFIDVSSVSEDEKDDMALLLADRLRDLSEDVMGGAAFTNMYRYQPFEGEYHQNFIPKGEKQTTIKAIYCLDFELDMAAARAVDFEDIPIIRAQVIAHDDQRIATNPLAFVDGFDYSLVRGLVYNGQWQFAPELIAELESREITVETETCEARVRRWIDRHKYNYNIPYAIVPTGPYAERKAEEERRVAEDRARWEESAKNAKTQLYAQAYGAATGFGQRLYNAGAINRLELQAVENQWLANAAENQQMMVGDRINIQGLGMVQVENIAAAPVRDNF